MKASVTLSCSLQNPAPVGHRDALVSVVRGPANNETFTKLASVGAGDTATFTVTLAMGERLQIMNDAGANFPLIFSGSGSVSISGAAGLTSIQNGAIGAAVTESLVPASGSGTLSFNVSALTGQRITLQDLTT